MCYIRSGNNVSHFTHDLSLERSTTFNSAPTQSRHPDVVTFCYIPMVLNIDQPTSCTDPRVPPRIGASGSSGILVSKHVDNMEKNRALAMTAAKMMQRQNGRSDAGGLESLARHSCTDISTGAAPSVRNFSGTRSSPGRRGLNNRRCAVRRSLRKSNSVGNLDCARQASRSSESSSTVSKNSSNRYSHSVHESPFETSLRERLEEKMRINVHQNEIVDSDRFERQLDESKLRYQHYRRLHDMGNIAKPVLRTNDVKLNVYDLLEHDVLLELSDSGCCAWQLPLGRCVQRCNDGLNKCGTGVYHVGIEINGIEYAYGMHPQPHMTGVFTSKPRKSPGFSYRTTIDFGKVRTTKNVWVEVPVIVSEKGSGGHTSVNNVYRQLEIFIDGNDVILEMADSYCGPDYNLLRKNCCHFARDALLRLGVKSEEIPTWFMSIAEAGVFTEDLVSRVDGIISHPIRQMFPDDDSIVESIGLAQSSASSDTIPNYGNENLNYESGFEVVFGQDNSPRRIIEVGDTHLHPFSDSHNLRKTPSWTY